MESQVKIVESDTELIALREGDETVFERIVRKHQNKVYNVCLSLLQNVHDAEDISQEVFISLFNHRQDLRGDANISTWLYRVAVNKSLEEIRKRKAKKRWSQFTSLFTFQSEEKMEVEFEHPGILLEKKELATILMKHIQKLSDNQKVAFTLHKIEGLTHKKIGEVMSLSESSVESLIHRAKANLRRMLKKYYNG